MDTERISLRALADKWLAPTPTRPLRVTRFGRTANGVRFVSIRVLRPSDPLTIAFFYHEDRIWRVFPPRTALVAMAQAYQQVA